MRVYSVTSEFITPGRTTAGAQVFYSNLKKMVGALPQFLAFERKEGHQILIPSYSTIAARLAGTGRTAFETSEIGGALYRITLRVHVVL